MAGASPTPGPASSPAAAPARTRLSRAERMEQTLAVAHELFAQRGYAAVTMDEVAAAVGVTKPLLYNYFGNKERLYVTCMERAGEALFAMIAEAVADAPNPSEALGAGVRGFFDFLDSDRAAWAVLFGETSSHLGDVAERVAHYRGRIAAMVADSLLSQLPRRHREAAHTEVEAMSEALLGAAEALARWWLRSETISAREAAELLIATIEPGLRVRSRVFPDSSAAGPQAGSHAPQAASLADGAPGNGIAVPVARAAVPENVQAAHAGGNANGWRRA
jgi:AcrR family transcriptional regulator